MITGLPAAELPGRLRMERPVWRAVVPSARPAYRIGPAPGPCTRVAIPSHWCVPIGAETVPCFRATASGPARTDQVACYVPCPSTAPVVRRARPAAPCGVGIVPLRRRRPCSADRCSSSRVFAGSGAPRTRSASAHRAAHRLVLLHPRGLLHPRRSPRLTPARRAPKPASPSPRAARGPVSFTAPVVPLDRRLCGRAAPSPRQGSEPVPPPGLRVLPRSACGRCASCRPSRGPCPARRPACHLCPRRSPSVPVSRPESAPTLRAHTPCPQSPPAVLPAARPARRPSCPLTAQDRTLSGTGSDTLRAGGPMKRLRRSAAMDLFQGRRF